MIAMKSSLDIGYLPITTTPKKMKRVIPATQLPAEMFRGCKALTQMLGLMEELDRLWHTGVQPWSTLKWPKIGLNPVIFGHYGPGESHLSRVAWYLVCNSRYSCAFLGASPLEFSNLAPVRQRPTRDPLLLFWGPETMAMSLCVAVHA